MKTAPLLFFLFPFPPKLNFFLTSNSLPALSQTRRAASQRNFDDDAEDIFDDDNDDDNDNGNDDDNNDDNDATTMTTTSETTLTTTFNLELFTL